LRVEAARSFGVTCLHLLRCWWSQVCSLRWRLLRCCSLLPPERMCRSGPGPRSTQYRSSRRREHAITAPLRVLSLRLHIVVISPANAPELFPGFLDDFRSAASRLNVAVAHLVEVSQGRVWPTQSWLNWWRRRGVRKRLLEGAAKLQQELGVEHPDSQVERS
jgi:hypothetical protein